MPQGFVSYTSDDPVSGRWAPLEDDAFEVPPNTKHGAVLALTREEWDRVRGAFG